MRPASLPAGRLWQTICRTSHTAVSRCVFTPFLIPPVNETCHPWPPSPLCLSVCRYQRVTVRHRHFSGRPPGRSGSHQLLALPRLPDNSQLFRGRDLDRVQGFDQSQQRPGELLDSSFTPYGNQTCKVFKLPPTLVYRSTCSARSCTSATPPRL